MVRVKFRLGLGLG